VQDRLAGTVVAPDGAAVHGPAVTWKGRRHGRRQDRRWATAWRPEQIARRLRLDYPEDKTMRISHEAIYQALFIQGRGAFKAGEPSRPRSLQGRGAFKAGEPSRPGSLAP
jgi:hypothetical protein